MAVTNWLIQQGVDLNPTDRWGMTPLEGAIFGNHQDIMNMLVNAGGKIKDKSTGQLLSVEESHLNGAVNQQTVGAYTRPLLSST